jgi:hypothetical protein
MPADVMARIVQVLRDAVLAPLQGVSIAAGEYMA